MTNEQTENVQIYPSRTRIVPNLKLAKILANLSPKKYDRAINGVTRNIVEKRNHKKHGDIRTPYKISNAAGYDNTDPLTEFDRAVLSVCISERYEGNNHTTPAIILRGLTGKVGRGDAEPSKNQREAILTSITKLMSTIIEVDLSETNEKLNYNGGKKQQVTGAILPCKFITTTINGKAVDDVIYFLDDSPIMLIAEERNQILRYDTAILDVPGQQNTAMNITVKNYLMNRVMEIKQHHMPPTLTFDDIFRKCRIDAASYKTQMDARASVEKFFEHLRANDVLMSFEIVRRRNKFHAITFAYK